MRLAVIRAVTPGEIRAEIRASRRGAGGREGVTSAPSAFRSDVGDAGPSHDAAGAPPEARGALGALRKAHGAVGALRKAHGAVGAPRKVHWPAGVPPKPHGVVDAPRKVRGA